MNERRNLLRSLARWTAIATLGTAFAALVGRGRSSAGSGACDGDRICTRCPQADDCVQPEAMSLRDARREPRT